MELILQASLHGYNCHALICAATGGLLLIGLRHLNRRMIEITTPRFKKQSTSRSAVYSVRLCFFFFFWVWFWLNFLVSSCTADWKWRKRAVEGALERKADWMRLERWDESTLQVFSFVFIQFMYRFLVSIVFLQMFDQFLYRFLVIKGVNLLSV